MDKPKNYRRFLILTETYLIVLTVVLFCLGYTIRVGLGDTGWVAFVKGMLLGALGCPLLTFVSFVLYDEIKESKKK